MDKTSIRSEANTVSTNSDTNNTNNFKNTNIEKILNTGVEDSKVSDRTQAKETRKLNKNKTIRTYSASQVNYPKFERKPKSHLILTDVR